MRKHSIWQVPARPRHPVVQAIARRLARAVKTLRHRATPDLLDLDQRVRQSGEW